MTDVARSHAPQLDALRGLAVLAVIFSHTIPEWKIGDFAVDNVGGYAVVLFFVLSSYLITSQLLATQADRLAWGDTLARPMKLFYGKRILRLFPAYYLALLLATGIGLEGLRSEFPWHALHLSNLMYALHPALEDTSLAGHFWSLSVEEQFYLIWPLLIFTVPDRLLPWAFGLFAAGGIYQWSTWNALPQVIDDLYLISAFDSFALGALVALGQVRGWSLSWMKYAAWPAAILCLASPIAQSLRQPALAKVLDMPSHEAMNLVFATIVLQSAIGFKGPIGAFLNLKSLRYLGQISYGLYIFHPFVHTLYLMALDRLDWPHNDLSIMVFVRVTLLSIACAALSWRWVEQPINRYRNRLRYTPPVPSAAPATALP